jgi:hypothetical protein
MTLLQTILFVSVASSAHLIDEILGLNQIDICLCFEYKGIIDKLEELIKNQKLPFPSSG